MDEFLKSEFNKLKNNNIISDEVYSKILDYYEKSEIFNLGVTNSEVKTEQPQQPVSEQPEVKVGKISAPVKEKKKINLQMLLSIISSLLIGGGIISLIAYNWNAISRFAKSITAFFICIMAPVLYVVLTKIRKVEFEQKSKEFFAILWNLLFGGSIAFISQTYRMASNPVAFFIVWLFISIGITYALKSYSSFIFSLILTLIYSIYSQQFTCNVAVAFYPAMFLNYFFTKKNKKYFYMWLVELIALIGVVFEKCLPGLWIIAYVSINILLLDYAEKEKDNNCKILGYIQAFILAVILTIPFFWEKIGFDFYRANARYNKMGGIVDYIVTFAVYAGSLGITLSSIIKNVKNKIALNITKVYELIVLVLVAVLYFCNSFIKDFSFVVPRIYLLLYFALCCYGILKEEKLVIAASISLFFYGLILCQINFSFVFLFTLLLTVCVLIQKINKDLNIKERKSSYSIIYILFLLIRIYSSSEYTFIFDTELVAKSKLLDLFIASALLILVTGYLIFTNVDLKKSIKEIFSKCVFYVAVLLLEVSTILLPYRLTSFSSIIDIFIAVVAILSCVDFILNKSDHSYYGLALFVANYFISSINPASRLFIFGILYLVLYGIHFYLGEKIQKLDNYNYLFAISYFVIFMIEYFIYYNNYFIARESFVTLTFDVKNCFSFAVLALILYFIPVITRIREKNIYNLSSLIISSASVVFLICNNYFKIFSSQNFIFTVLIIVFVVSSYEVFVNKKIENLVILAASLIFCFVELSFNQNYFNGVAFLAMLFFALYYYSSLITEDDKSIKIVITAGYSVLMLVSFIMSTYSGLENDSDIKLFGSAEKIISTIVMLPVLIGIPSFYYVKNKKIPSLSAISFTLVTVLFYLLNDYCKLFGLENYFFVLSIAVAISSFADTFIFNRKNNLCLFVISLVKFIANVGYCSVSVIMLIILVVFALFIYSKKFIGEKDFITATVTLFMSVLMMISMCFEFHGFSAKYIFTYFDANSELVKFYISAAIVLITMFIIPCFFCIKDKLKLNYMEIAFCLLWIVNFIVTSVNENLNFNIMENISRGFTLGIIITFCIMGLYFSYQKSSLKSANYFLIFLSISFIVRFFMISKGLVERGLVCIVCGICILVLNILFSKKLSRNEEK